MCQSSRLAAIPSRQERRANVRLPFLGRSPPFPLAMPLNATTYLTERGWAGKGVPLDGAAGRGLKKPLALPMKRGLKGLGKERDRAVEWWDCVFEAGAKKLGSGTSSNGRNSPKEKDHAEHEARSRSNDAHLSLEAQAKRSYARRVLMNGFVRGKPDERQQKQQEELERLLAEQEKRHAKTRVERAGKTDGIASKSDRKGKRKEDALGSAAEKATDESDKAAKQQRKEERRRKRAEEKALKKTRATVPGAAARDGKESLHEEKKRKRIAESDTAYIAPLESTSRQTKKKRRREGHEAINGDVVLPAETKNKSKDKSDRVARKAAKKAAKTLASQETLSGFSDASKEKDKKKDRKKRSSSSQ